VRIAAKNPAAPPPMMMMSQMGESLVDMMMVSVYLNRPGARPFFDFP
jgi:hypothetical protein